MTSDIYYSFAKHNMLGDTSKYGVINLARLSYDITGKTRMGLNGYVNLSSIRSKSDFVKGLIALEESGRLDDLSSDERKRVAEFEAIVSPEAFFKKVSGSLYDVTIDGRRHTLPVDNLLHFLVLPENELFNLCTTGLDGEIGSLSKAEFAYAAKNFLQEKRALNDYVFSEDLENRMNNLMLGRLIDFSAINRLTETKETLHKKININPELREAIFNEMPENLNKLEKAIYIFLKMCMTLTYDNRFYAANQRGEIAEIHKNLDYIEHISPTNNDVVCFEFNLIYAKFLDELGLTFESAFGEMTEEGYGVSHANLRFRAGRFIVNADSVKGILGGDIVRTKLGLPITGLRCENRNAITVRDFEDSVSKIYKLIQQQEKAKNPWNEYDLLTKNLLPLKFDQRKFILLDTLSATSLRGIDAMSYALKLEKALFSSSEQLHNVSVVVLRNNRPTDPDYGFETGAVIAVNETNLLKQPDKTDYYYLSSKGEFDSLSQEDIISKLEDRIFEYIDRSTPTIPGATKDGEQLGGYHYE